ncbi:Hpt domain-containing protein [Sphingomonas tabacisoli]|uniref:Hpt domain-containing protein n=1 Tax=Sphingomonas tabacisoli TaxID=2249466 RepID=A0ABW4I1J3_9SPHN
MSFEQALSTSLAAAVGDDQALVAELRGAFLDSATRHLDAMRVAANDADWREAGLRLKGLAASFGATTLMEQADRAALSRRGDTAAIQGVESGLAVLSL